jgi:hypothetical protein
MMFVGNEGDVAQAFRDVWPTLEPYLQAALDKPMEAGVDFLEGSTRNRLNVHTASTKFIRAYPNHPFDRDVGYWKGIQDGDKVYWWLTDRLGDPHHAEVMDDLG